MNRSIRSKPLKKDYSRIPQKTFLLLSLFIVLLFVVFSFMKISNKHNLITQNMSVEPISNLGNTIEKGHKIAYLKDKQEVWIYDLDSESEKIIAPGIDESFFCGEGGCQSRTFQFSAAGKKLVIDLVRNGTEAGFSIVDFTDSSLKTEYIYKGYSPTFSHKGNGIFFYDKNYYPRTLFHIDLTTKQVRKVGSYSPVGSLSNGSEVLNFDDIQQEQIGIFSILDINTFTVKNIVIADLMDNKKIIKVISPSPDKNKVMISFTQKPGMFAIGIVNADGSSLTTLLPPLPKLEDPGIAPNYGNLISASWSPDGRYIATQVFSAYRELPSNINIYEINKDTLVTQIPITMFLRGTKGCWVSSINGEILVSLASTEDSSGRDLGKLRLHNLIRSKEKILDLPSAAFGDHIACY